MVTNLKYANQAPRVKLFMPLKQMDPKKERNMLIIDLFQTQFVSEVFTSANKVVKKRLYIFVLKYQEIQAKECIPHIKY